MSRLTIKELNTLKSEEYLKKMYDEYNSGIISYEEYATYMLKLLEGFIKTIASKKLRSSKNVSSIEYEDLIQSCREAVLSRLEEYDPYMGYTPSTYFHRYFKQYMSLITPIDGTTRHYKSTMRKMDDFARSKGFAGAEDSGYPPEVFSIALDMPIATIIKAVEYSARTICSLNSFEDNILTEEGFEANSSYDARSPEAIVSENELTNRLNKALSSLTPTERFTVIEITVNSRTYRDLCIDINETPEVLKLFEEEGYVTVSGKICQNSLQAIHTRAITKLKDHEQMVPYVDPRETERQIQIGGISDEEEEEEGRQLYNQIESGVIVV